MAAEPQLTTDALNRINKRCYDLRADYWDRFPFKDFLPAFVHKYYNPSLGKKVLDIGSGTGILSKWLADEGFDVLCLDPSDEMVKRCRLKGLHTLQKTIQDYQSQDSFSMVFAVLSLIHVPKCELPDQIRKIAGMLLNGGTLFLGLIEGDSEGLQEQNGGLPRFFANYSKEEIIQLFNQDFSLLDYRHVNGPTRYMFFAFKRL